jgi:hypothetical protein
MPIAHNLVNNVKDRYMGCVLSHQTPQQIDFVVQCGNVVICVMVACVTGNLHVAHNVHAGGNIIHAVFFSGGVSLVPLLA